MLLLGWKEGWFQLFHGKDLAGWTPKITGHAVGENFANTFQVEDSYRTVSYDGYDSFARQLGHLFYKDNFSYQSLPLNTGLLGNRQRTCQAGPLAIAASWCMGYLSHCRTGRKFVHAPLLEFELQNL